MNTEILSSQPKRGFINSEFEERVDKAQKIMFEQQLDSIFVTTPQNIRYFSGFDTLCSNTLAPFDNFAQFSSLLVKFCPKFFKF